MITKISDLAAKLTQQATDLGAVHTQLQTDKTQILARLDQLGQKIDALAKQIADGEVPADAAAQIDAIDTDITNLKDDAASLGEIKTT